ncbi:hypothetical protein AB0K18_30805 [Nonomuraea sp. NPDC049421]|uniref:hypothetical protein n=1 Tax=Nonomuraea sp. NPDC049421 TaxID=3155275 RepID=UPI00343BAC87
MGLIKKLTAGAFIAAVVTVPAAPAIATTGAPASAVQADPPYGRTGPFPTLGECNKAKREWDIDHYVSSCYWNDATGWWFEWFTES